MTHQEPIICSRVFLTISETAMILRVSERTLGRWRKSRQPDLPFTESGERILYGFTDVMDFLKNTCGTTFECRPGTGCGIMDLTREGSNTPSTSDGDEDFFGFS